MSIEKISEACPSWPVDKCPACVILQHDQGILLDAYCDDRTAAQYSMLKRHHQDHMTFFLPIMVWQSELKRMPLESTSIVLKTYTGEKLELKGQAMV